MTHSGNFGNIFGNGVFDLWSQGLFVKKCLVEDEPEVDPLGVEPLGVGVNLGVNLGNDMKESAEDADDFADGDDMELELFDRDVGLLQTLVIGDKRCLKSEIWNSLSNLVNWKYFEKYEIAHLDPDLNLVLQKDGDWRQSHRACVQSQCPSCSFWRI